MILLQILFGLLILYHLIAMVGYHMALNIRHAWTEEFSEMFDKYIIFKIIFFYRCPIWLTRHILDY